MFRFTMALGACAVLLWSSPEPDRLAEGLTGPVDVTAGPLVAAMALLAWACLVHLTVVLVLVRAARLPGRVGLVCSALADRLAPRALRRACEVLLGVALSTSTLIAPAWATPTAAGVAAAVSAAPSPAGAVPAPVVVGPVAPAPAPTGPPAGSRRPDLDWPDLDWPDLDVPGAGALAAGGGTAGAATAIVADPVGSRGVPDPAAAPRASSSAGDSDPAAADPDPSAGAADPGGPAVDPDPSAGAADPGDPAADPASSAAPAGGPAVTSGDGDRAATPGATAPDASAVPPGTIPGPGTGTGTGTTAPTGSVPATHVVVVRPGDTLWSIASQALGPHATTRRVAAAWPTWWSANRQVIGDDPDLLQPGMHLTPPHP